MLPPKAPTPRKKKGLLPKLRGFLEALGDRYHRALQVIDEALASDNLKDKIWAVDWILKRSTGAVATDGELQATPAKGKKAKPLQLADFQDMGEPELLSRIKGHLKDWEPG